MNGNHKKYLMIVIFDIQTLSEIKIFIFRLFIHNMITQKYKDYCFLKIGYTSTKVDNLDCQSLSSFQNLSCLAYYRTITFKLCNL